MYQGETSARIVAPAETAEKRNECVQVVLTGPPDACHLLAKLIQTFGGFSIEAENPEHLRQRQSASADLASVVLLCYQGDEALTLLTDPIMSGLTGEATPTGTILHDPVETCWRVSSPKDEEIGAFLGASNGSDVASVRSASAEVTKLANRKGGEASSTGNRSGVPEASLRSVNVVRHRSLYLGRLQSDYRHMTAREEQTARLAAQGFSNAQIAQRLSTRIATVKSHLQNVFNKLDIQRRSQLVVFFAASTTSETSRHPVPLLHREHGKAES